MFTCSLYMLQNKYLETGVSTQEQRLERSLIPIIGLVLAIEATFVFQNILRQQSVNGRQGATNLHLF